MFVVKYSAAERIALPEYIARPLGVEGDGNMKFAAQMLLMTINLCNAFGRVASGPKLHNQIMSTSSTS